MDFIWTKGQEFLGCSGFEPTSRVTHQLRRSEVSWRPGTSWTAMRCNWWGPKLVRSGATTCPSTCTSTTKLSVTLALQPSMVTLLIFKRLIFWLWSQISLSQISFWLVTLGFLFDLWLLGFFLTCDFGFLFGSGFCNQWGQYISGICSSVYRKVLVAEMARPRNTPRPWTHQPMPPPPKAPFVAWLWLEIIFCTWVLYWLCGYLWLLGTCGYLCLLVVTCGYLWLPAGCICHQRRPSSILPLLMYTYVVLLTKKKMMFWVTWFIDFWLTSAKASRCLTV